jgi:1-acyl-sn-glycerol-3-phosphate acyltransferase
MARPCRFHPATFISGHEQISSSFKRVQETHPPVIVLAVIRTIFAAIVSTLGTAIGGIAAIIASLFGVEDRPGGIYDQIPRIWSRIILWTAGVRAVLHNPERIAEGAPRVFMSNHLSWFDIPILATVLPRYKFVAKAELFRVPVFGAAIRAVGMVPIERHNRKAAFAAYDVAAEKIRAGNSMVVFPEGSRGHDYPIRPLKKGPFVLAIAAGVPIVPVLIHGTRDVFAKGTMLVRSGPVNVHFLEPVPTAGLDYTDRQELAETVRSSLVDALFSLYRIASEPTRVQPQTVDSE